ncbi:MAG TPA: outer membrane beta-barrel protein [Terracidiphilus sp.]|nr:outer membrane beta-barrel protein [Terracidiphilus sp.]
MLIKRSILALLCFAFSSVALVSAHGQVVPSATERVFSVRVGGLASAFQPDYTNEGSAITGPQRLYGIGAYVDARFTRWIQPELEMRWGRFNEWTCNGECAGVDENTYSVGDRVPIKTFHKFTPYGKILVGLGNASWLSGNAFVVTYGGGVDYRLNRKFTIRCADFEYQEWPVSSPNPLGGTTSFTIWPYGLSAGMSYRIF